MYCHEISIIGTSFYILEFINGRICTDPSLQEHFPTAHERQQAYQHVIHVLALLHTIDLSPFMDYDMLLNGGIINHGSNRSILDGKRTTTFHKNLSTGTKKGNFIERQLVRLEHVSKRQSSELERLAHVHRASASASDVSIMDSVSTMMHQLDPVMAGLQQYAPFCPGSSCRNDISTTGQGAMLIHGDYKIDNIVFHPTLPKVMAVIDWELASIHNDGVDPYCDVANLCMMYFIPKQAPAGNGTTTVITGIADLSDLEMQSLGIPLRKELIRTYCSERNQLQWTFRSFPSSFVNTPLIQVDDSLIYDWSGYYLTFLFFKNCIILQGVLQRTLAAQQVSVPLFWSGQANDSDGIETIAAKKKVRVLLRLLPVTIHLTDAVWRQHPPPSFQTSHL